MATQNTDRINLKERGDSVREDFSDIISLLPTDELVLTSNIGSFGSMAKNTYRSWQVDDLGAIDLDNSLVDGGQFLRSADDQPARIGFYHQTSYKMLEVSRRADIVNTAGRKTETARQVVKKSRYLRRDMEGIMLSGQATVEGDGDTIAGLTPGLGAWARFNTSRGATGADPALSDTDFGAPTVAPTDGTLRALDEQTMFDIDRSMYERGASLNMWIMGTQNKQNWSQYMLNRDNPSARIVEPRSDVGTPKSGIGVNRSVSSYVSDFNLVDIVPSRHVRSRDIFALDKDYVKLSYLDGFHTRDVETDRDSRAKALIVDWGLGVENPEAIGGIFDIDATLPVLAQPA